MRLHLLLLVLFAAFFAVSPADSQAQRPGFYFVNTPDTLHFFTNSSQSIVIYAKNMSDVPLNYYPDQRHNGGNYGQFEVDDESFIDLTPPGELVKTIITYTPDNDTWYKSVGGMIYLYDTGFVACDSIYFIGVKDTNLATAKALGIDTLLDFGKVDLGQSHTAQLLMKNVSNETLTVDTIMLNGYKYIRQYTIDELPSLPFSLQPNQSKIFELTFTPNGSPQVGGNDLMINYHIGETFQTATVELWGESGKFAAGSADTLDLGPVPMYAFVGKKVRLKNNLADSVEVYDYDPTFYPNLVVVMDSEGDSMVLGPQEEKEVIIYGLGMGMGEMEQEVRLEFTTHNGPLFHLGFVDVIVKTQETQEDLDNPNRIFPLMANTTMFIPYGATIKVFTDDDAEFGETLNFENIEDHAISVTEVMNGDSSSTGYVEATLPTVLDPDELFTVQMDRYDTVEATGWLLIITDSSDVVKTKVVDLPPIVNPTKGVKQAPEQLALSITGLGDRMYQITAADIEAGSITIYDLLGRKIDQGPNGMNWHAPNASQFYVVIVEGKQRGEFIRRAAKIFVK